MGYAKEWLTKDEWQKLRNAPQEKYDRDGYYRQAEYCKWRDELLLRLMYKAGLRISEALDLQYPYNFRTEEGMGYVVLKPDEETSKTEEELQPIGKETVRDVSNFMTAFHKNNKSNFVIQVSRQRAYQIANELGDEVGIDKKLGTHTFRRSRAKHLLESGQMDLSEVSRFLRHDKLATTMEYLSFVKKGMAQKVDNIDDENNL